MHPVLIIILFFGILAVLIWVAAFSQRKSVRISSAILAFGWACLMFIAARWVESLNHNAWYSSAASEMLKACIGGLEQGREEVVLGEMKKMSDQLEVTYENRGNFRELAEQMTENLNIEPVVDSNRGSDISDIGSITPVSELQPENSAIDVSYEYDGEEKLILSIHNIMMNAAAKGVIGSIVIKGNDIFIRPRERYDVKGPVESVQLYTIRYVIQNVKLGRYSLNHDDSDAEGQDRQIKVELDLTVAGKGKMTLKFEESDVSEDPFIDQ
jgi:hypothetical protein